MGRWFREGMDCLELWVDCFEMGWTVLICGHTVWRGDGLFMDVDRQFREGMDCLGIRTDSLER